MRDKIKFITNCDAVTDMIGALLLTAVAVLALSTASVFVFSTYQGATDTPHVDVDGWVDVGSDTITLRHSGGESIDKDDMNLILEINGETVKIGPEDIDTDGDTWDLGDTIVLDKNDLPSLDGIEEGDYVGATIVHLRSNVVVKSGVLLGGEGGTGSGSGLGDGGDGGDGGGDAIVGDPISWWNFDDGGMNDSISDNDGIINHGATPTTGIDGEESALYFDGNGNADGTGNDEDYIEINYQIIAEYPFTISAWIKTNSSNGYIFDAANSSSQTIYYGIYVTNDNAAIIAKDKNGGIAKEEGDTTIKDDNWHNIVGVFTSNEIKLYVDGNHEVTGANDQDYSNSVDRWAIGGLGTANVNNHFEGTIDEVLLWDKALNATQVQELYDSFNPN